MARVDFQPSSARGLLELARQSRTPTPIINTEMRFGHSRAGNDRLPKVRSAEGEDDHANDDRRNAGDVVGAQRHPSTLPISRIASWMRLASWFLELGELGFIEIRKLLAEVEQRGLELVCVGGLSICNRAQEININISTI